ncbi:phosphate ABC transporter substrate-binding protein PstS, partial [uncultured Nocardioides sp.]|uniref:phosphate ABC transporter substrate-binding protein PstS n=1 Tax=uncultured Nocardioides sp. TaxID=198441 RepID=UPI00261951E2
MKTPTLRRAVLPGVAALALALTACGSSDEDGADGADGVSLSGQYTIGGASTQEAAMTAWSVGFTDVQPEAEVTYEPIGSGGGRENFVAGGYPLAGSDAYLDNDEGELDAAIERCGGEDVLEFPSYISPIALVFNVDGVDELNLSPETIAGIFSGEIKQWDAKEIAADNPDADLPSAPINPVHRSDESGTTGNFTNYLATRAADTWTAGELEVWPKEFGGEGAQGTSGVVSAVTDGKNSIGYADASQAGDLGKALIGVGDDFVGPTAEAAAKILEVSPKAESAGENQLIFDLDYNTAESGTYPIVLTSYLLACMTYEDQAEADVTKAYISYILSDDGQEFAASEAGSAPLADSLQ